MSVRRRSSKKSSQIPNKEILMSTPTTDQTLLAAREEINRIDREMADLFCRRMRAVQDVAEYKKSQGLPVLDAAREREVIDRNAAYIENEALRPYYISYLKATMALSRAYQQSLLQTSATGTSDPFVIERGGLSRAAEVMVLTGRRVCIVTDTGVPAAYADAIARQCESPVVFRFEAGESHKTMETLTELLTFLIENNFDRRDAIVAVGGGVVSDLAGFAAAIYMRGIDFYTVPTTLLAMVDASVGGKTAVDFESYKNIIGAFWQPRAVLIDPETLDTLPHRRISDGLAEVIKMAATSDAALFETLEKVDLLPAEGEPLSREIDDIIARALAIKMAVVEQDEREVGLRRVLNFGHTLGHAIESLAGLGERYHGECVALGMIPMCAPEVRARLIPLLSRCGLPTSLDVLPAREDVLRAIGHDKKARGEKIAAVVVPRVGEFVIEDTTADALADTFFGQYGCRKELT
jgi:3-dehydroquinate synthase